MMQIAFAQAAFGKGTADAAARRPYLGFQGRGGGSFAEEGVEVFEANKSATMIRKRRDLSRRRPRE